MKYVDQRRRRHCSSVPTMTVHSPDGKPDHQAKGGQTGAQEASGGAAAGGAAGGATGTGAKNKIPAPKPQMFNTPPPPIGRDDGLVHLSSAALQQMLAAAVAGAVAAPVAASDHGNKLPKFWEEEPEAWFSVFRGHFAGRQVPELAMFNRMLPLLPTLAVSLCCPLVANPPDNVFAQAERLLLRHYQLSPLECGRLLYNCTSLGDRTPTAMLQYMRTLQPLSLIHI